MMDDRLDIEPLRAAADSLALSFDLLAAHEGKPAERLLLRDGVIQRFEYAFELGWKTLRRYIEAFGLERVDHLSNRELFRRGSEMGLLEDPEAWMEFLRLRNMTSHVYNESVAERVFSIAAPYLVAVRQLLAAMEESRP